MLTAIVYQFGVIVQRLATSGSVGGDLTGPIGIAVYTNEVTNLGISYVLEFAALISINLAIINILPIPALDGGRILFVIFEKIRGKRITGNFERISHTVGFALLIALMVFIAFKDAQKYF
jgi:regulator of sigma E protease